MFQVFLEFVVGNAASLLEAWHAFSDFNVNVAVGDKVKQVVLVDDFLGNELQRELHVFVALHRCAIVEIFYIQYHVFGVRSRDGAVEMTLGSGEACALCRGHTRVVEFVTTDGDADTVDLGLGWTDGGNEASIRDFAVLWNGLPFDEENDIGTKGLASTDSLGESAEIVGQ